MRCVDTSQVGNAARPGLHALNGWLHGHLVDHSSHAGHSANRAYRRTLLMCVLNNTGKGHWPLLVCTFKRHGEEKPRDASLFVTVCVMRLSFGSCMVVAPIREYRLSWSSKDYDVSPVVNLSSSISACCLS